MADGPTPEQRADYLVRKLEQTIRDNRTVRGMSFSTWQSIAREEITNAMFDVERRFRRDDRSVARLLLVGAAALVTIGFWGAVVAADHSWGNVGAVVALTAGGALLVVAAKWGLDRATGEWAKAARKERLAHIEDLDRRIKRMEAEMKKKHDRLKDRMEEVGEI